jgi:hypothetical protein
MTLREKLERFDAQSDNFAKAAKQPWECETYAEFLASLPEDEQPVQNDE